MNINIYTCRIVILLALAFGNVVTFAQTLKVNSQGDGFTEEEAIRKALRNALERTSHSFISSTTIFSNDEITYDEIAQVTKGNIAKFELLNSNKNADGTYSVMVESYISVEQLTNYVNSKGADVRVDGSSFYNNFVQKVKIANFNKDNELLAIKHLLIELNKLCCSLYDYSISSSEPVINKSRDSVSVTLNVQISPNNNHKSFNSYLNKTLLSLNLSAEEETQFKELNLEGPFSYGKIKLRNSKSIYLLKKFVNYLKNYSKEDYNVIDNLGKVYSHAKNNKINLKFSLNDFSKINSFSITPLNHYKPFIFSNDALATEFDKTNIGFLKHTMTNTFFDRIKILNNMVCCDIMENEYYYVGKTYKTLNYPAVKIELTNDKMRMEIRDKFIWDYTIKANTAIISALTEKGKRVLELKASDGFGLPRLCSARDMRKNLFISFESQDSLEVEVHSKMWFEDIKHKGKSYVRAVREIIIPLSELKSSSPILVSLSSDEKKRAFCRMICLYSMDEFRIDYNNLIFKYYTDIGSTYNYQQQKTISRYQRITRYDSPLPIQTLPSPKLLYNMFSKLCNTESDYFKFGIVKYE